MPYARVEAAVFTTMYGTQEAEWPAAGGGAEEGAGRPVTAADAEGTCGNDALCSRIGHYPGAERREGCRGTDVFLTAGSAFVRRRHREQIEKRSAMTLTVYDKQLIGEVERMFPDHHAGEVVERLIRMGVVDTVRCKILVVREYVNELVGRGTGKVDAMYMAAEKFCCSYEYVRKCMYYYKEVNLA